MQIPLPWLALDIAATAAECRDVEDVRSHLLPALVAATGADLAIYHQIVMGPGMQEYGVVWPDQDVVADLAGYPAVAQHSPLMRHYQATGHPGVVCISQLLSAREWHENPLYRESHRNFGIEDQMALALHLRDGRGHAVTLARSLGSFSEADRELLTVVAPHIRAAVRRSLGSTSAYRVVRTFPTPTWTWRSGPAVSRAGDPRPLTSRELEVFALAKSGYTSRQVARQLDLAPRTVDKHLENVFRKLGATCRADAASRLQELGLGLDSA